MVDVLGHLGMALIWLAPAWYFIDRRETAAVVVAAGFWFGMLPDVDLVLSNWFAGIHHHGVFHTVLVVTILAAILGPMLGWVLRTAGSDDDWFSPAAEANALKLGFLAVWVAGLSHIFADMLSAPDASTRIEPLWPLVNGPIVTIDVLWYQSFWATWVLFFLGIGINVAAWYWKGESGEAQSSAVASE